MPSCSRERSGSGGHPSRSYLGSLTVPFRDFNFVLKCQCLERGTTGIKEAILLDRSWAAHEPKGEGELPPGWDPDAPRYDPEFPDHPVARARRTLDHVQKSFEVTSEVRKLPGFALPDGQM
jgi:hypothetical protein